MTGRRPQVDLRREPEDLLGPLEIAEDIAPDGADRDLRHPRNYLSFAAHDPRVPVVAEAIGTRWAMWLENEDRPAPPVAEGEAEWIIDALDAWIRDQLSATGTPTAGHAIIALVSKLSRTQAALHASVLANQTGAQVSAEVVEAWAHLANGETSRPASDGLSG